MDTRVELYIGRQLTTDTLNGQRVDFFPDEKINLTLKDVDVTDIGKNYADYSQSFTVPCSEKNENIFKFYWNIDNNNQFNANIKVSARLDLNSQMFRLGKVQLENGEMRNGKPAFYKITFYSNLVALKDKFGDDTLNDLGFVKDLINGTSSATPTQTLQQYDFTYNDSEVYNRIANVNSTVVGTFYSDDVVIPPASVIRVWNYKNNSYDNDIQYLPAPFNWSGIIKEEVRPAIKMKHIVGAIEERYQLKFSNDFFGSRDFDRAYLWCNKNDASYITNPQTVLINPLALTASYTDPNRITDVNDGSFIFTRLRGIPGSEGYQNIYNVAPDSTALNTKYNLYILNYQGSVLAYRYQLTGTQSIGIAGYGPGTRSTSLLIQPESGFTASIYVDAKAVNLGSGYVIDHKYSTTVQRIRGGFSIIENLPTMTVYDFMVSLQKMYSLCYLTDTLDDSYYRVLSKKQYFDEGKVVNLTDYTNPEKVTFDRFKIYKNLSFNYEKNESYTNATFFNTFNREYGNEVLKNINGGDGDYVVDPKFRIPYVVKLGDWTIPLTSVNVDGEAQLNQPTIFQYGGQQGPTSSGGENRFGYIFRATDGSNNYAVQPLSKIPLMGVDSYYPSYPGANFDDTVYNNSITFSEEYDADGILRDNSLYNAYYRDYIEQVYSLKTRIWNFNCVIPAHILYDLTLNDIIEIGDYRYNISEVKVELNTGEAQLKLINKKENGLI